MDLKSILYQLKSYYHNAEKVEKIILDCALVAALASGVGGVIPVFAIPGMIISCFGAVWAMYGQICTCLEIRFRKNVLKVLASAALSNIAANLAAMLAVEVLAAFIPVSAVAASAVLTFCTIYLAGLMFTKMLLAFAKKGKYGAQLAEEGKDSLKQTLASQSVDKADLKAAKSVAETACASK